jgi:hypothetical protein
MAFATNEVHAGSSPAGRSTIRTTDVFKEVMVNWHDA